MTSARPARAAGAGTGAIWVLGDPVTVRAFRLVGLPGTIVGGAAEARAALERLRVEGAALVIATEAVADALGGPATLVSDGVAPLVVVVPSARGPGVAPAHAERIAGLVRRALGVPGERRQ